MHAGCIFILILSFCLNGSNDLINVDYIVSLAFAREFLLAYNLKVSKTLRRVKRVELLCTPGLELYPFHQSFNFAQDKYIKDGELYRTM